MGRIRVRQWHVPCLNGSAEMFHTRGGFDSSTVASLSDDDSDALASMSQGPDINEVLRRLLDDVACALGVPTALLSRDTDGWQFEAEAFPPRPVGEATRFRGAAGWNPDSTSDVLDQAGTPWTALLAATLREREWLLLLPGKADKWRGVGDLEGLVARFGQSLDAAVREDDERQREGVQRRLYAFTRRLTRRIDTDETLRLIVQTMAREATAETASCAIFDEAEQTLTIAATLGYPAAVVDHVRIAPREGILGQAFVRGRAAIGRTGQSMRRLRYRTDSYMTVPLVASGRALAVVTLTDRADGKRFDARDLAAVKLFAAPAALSLARLRLAHALDDLTRAATVDSVTGLFNRRYFETRIQAEVQRSRRMRQDLALLMVDIDDFKRINDTFGHLEGDRALRDVADLLRRGVRIFDVCARYGGEEFAIVMPGASREMAVLVAERIRRGMDERSKLSAVPMTVSIGVGFLGGDHPDQSEEGLIAAADRALFAAKRAGKNIVKTD